jgi:hypothetical protein
MPDVDLIPDRVGFFRNGWLLDELFSSACSLDLRRSWGEREARGANGAPPITTHRFEGRLVSPLISLELDLWTSPRASLVPDLENSSPHWLELRIDDGRLCSLFCADAAVHFEHLTRNAHYLGLSQGRDPWRVSFLGGGYVKLAPRRRAHPTTSTVELPFVMTPEALRLPLAEALRVAPDRLAFGQPSCAPLAQRAVPVALAAQSGDFPLAISVPSREQDLPIAARLARTLGHEVALPRPGPVIRRTIVTSHGDIVPHAPNET